MAVAEWFCWEAGGERRERSGAVRWIELVADYRGKVADLSDLCFCAETEALGTRVFFAPAVHLLRLLFGFGVGQIGKGNFRLRVGSGRTSFTVLPHLASPVGWNLEPI
jgi:hypothetical protein